MKKLLSALVLTTVALSAQADEAQLPQECQAYAGAIEQMATINSDVATKLKEELEATKKQWASMDAEQQKGAGESCKVAHEKTKPML